MARIPDIEIERLKREVSLPRVLEAQGLALIKQGKDLVCRCPWHAGDDTPSCVITLASNLWHCFGCDAGGSVIDWVMRVHRVSFRHACELLIKDLPIAPVESLSVVKGRSLHGRPAADLAQRDDDQALLNQVIGDYHETLKQSREALMYLDKRGLGSLPLIERFRLGFANRTLAYRLPSGEVKAGAQVRSQLQRLGILRGTGHEHFNGSLVVPLFDAERNVVQVYGRKITESLRAGTAKHLYLPSPHRGVFNLAGIERGSEVILCEALIDALTVWHAGYENTTAAFGVNGVTDELLSALAKKRVLIAFDGDEPGDAGTAALLPKLQAIGCDVFRIVFPRGEDANSYALKAKPAQQSLGVLIRSAVWLGDGARPALTSRCTQSVHQWVQGDEPNAERRAAAAASVAVQVPADAALSVESSAAATTAAPPAKAETAPLPSSPRLPSPSPPQSSASPIPAVSASAQVPPLAAVPLADAVPILPLLPAMAVPPAPADDVAKVDERQVEMVFGERRYRVRGFAKNTSFEVMKVNVLVSGGEAVHIDVVDLYSAKHRTAFARAAAAELGVEDAAIQRDLGKLLLKLEQLQDARLEATLAPKNTQAAMTDVEHAAALDLLRDPALIERIVRDVDQSGLVGEAANTLVAYLACVSRKLDAPLALIIQSTSAAGKSTLMDAALALVPEEDRVHYSAMTGQSLFYLGSQSVKHKVLAIAEEEGVRQAAYALKVLQSQGELTIASTGKDPTTGLLVTQEYRVEGPVMLFLTTTAIDIDEELLNRCMVLTIDESREQTRAIQQRQRTRRTLDGLIAKREQDTLLKLHRNAQRLLRPLAVVNPYAEQLTFLDDRTRTRRDHQKYLTLIEAIALLHQYQRPLRVINGYAGKAVVEYIEVEPSDIALANKLAHEVLGRSLDELPPHTRRLLAVIRDLVDTEKARLGVPQCEVRLTRKAIRDASALSDTRLRLHIERLVEMEYLLAHAGKQGRRFLYELAFDGEIGSDAPQLVGLIDAAKLRAGSETTTTTTSPGSVATSPGSRESSPGSRSTSPVDGANFAPVSPAINLPFAGPSPGSQKAENSSSNAAFSEINGLAAQNALFPGKDLDAGRSASPS